VLNALYLLIGIALLTLGGEMLIRGALGAANRLGISPLLSGLVIMGFGTSMPEMAVSVGAALGGQPDIAIGNIVGSNIANILLILGLCAVITPLAVSAAALKRDAVVVIGASLLFILLATSNNLSHQDAAILLLSLFAYLGWAYWSEKLHTAPSTATPQAEAGEIGSVPKSIGASALAIAFGFFFLFAGSQVLLKGAVGLAHDLGVSEALIGLTLVAVGTSLPELTVSVMSALRRHPDMAVGTILGSNIFNLLGILGVSALLQPLEVRGRILAFDQWVMLGVAVLLLVFLYSGRRLSRLEGGVLLMGYAAYLGANSFSVGG